MRSAIASGPGRELQALDVSAEQGAVALNGRAPRDAVKGEAGPAAARSLRRAGQPTRVEDRIKGPLDVVKAGVRKQFGDDVVTREARNERGRLTPVGDISKFGHSQPARELAILALEQAGFGPITDWGNHLKRTKRGE